MKRPDYSNNTHMKYTVYLPEIPDKFICDIMLGKVPNDNEFCDPTFAKVYMKEGWRVKSQLTPTENYVMDYILFHHALKSNILNATYNDIADAVGMSVRTIERAMVKLQQLDFLRWLGDNRWMLNPRLITATKDEKETQLHAIYGGLKKKRHKQGESD